MREILKQMEMIGKVKLNYTYYTGEDSYSDGAIEDDLLRICRQNLMEDALGSNTAWPVLYHLSPIRQNIIEWYPMKQDASVLEIGAGCGAITGILSKKAKKVTCIELSRKRSQINAWQNRECSNVEIYVGKYEDIQMSEKYDYITLIGVLEYAGSYTTGENPYLTMLEQIRSMLKPNGKILIAIENRMGLKYLNGAKEDHSRNLFEGVHAYPSGNYVQTFTRPELSKLLCSAGLPYYRFYYPMPDYKMPSMILSDEYQVEAGTFHEMEAVYDVQRLCFFHENLVWDTLNRDGELGYFANSFFVEAGAVDNLSEILYVKYSRLRKKEFQTRLLISRDMKTGKPMVYKSGLYPEGEEHIAAHIKKCQDLKNVYKNLDIVDTVLLENGSIASPYIEGSTVSNILLQYKDRRKQLVAAIKRYLDKILNFSEECLLPFEMSKEFEEVFGDIPWENHLAVNAVNIDSTFDNIIEQSDGSLYLIDNEWIFNFSIPVVYLKFRILYWYFYKFNAYLPFSDLQDFMSFFGFDLSSEELVCCVGMEAHFVEYVQGSQASVFKLEAYEKEILHLDDICHTVLDYQAMYQKSMNYESLKNKLKICMKDYEALERKLEMHIKNEERLRKRLS